MICNECGNDILVVSHKSWCSGYRPYRIEKVEEELTQLRTALTAANARAELRDRIFVQVYKAVERIAPENVELLCVLGSIGDSLPDTDALECLEQFNEHGTYKTEVLFDVSDTPTDRRKRFKLVALADDAKEGMWASR